MPSHRFHNLKVLGSLEGSLGITQRVKRIGKVIYVSARNTPLELEIPDGTSLTGELTILINYQRCIVTLMATSDGQGITDVTPNNDQIIVLHQVGKIIIQPPNDASTSIFGYVITSDTLDNLSSNSQIDIVSSPLLIDLSSTSAEIISPTPLPSQEPSFFGNLRARIPFL